jgi:hypothetical protein
VLIFGWVVGAERGVREVNRGADLRVPDFMAVVIRWITPTFLIFVLTMWCFFNGPERLRGMSPSIQGAAAARAVYRTAIAERPEFRELNEEDLEARTTEVLGVAKGVPETLDGLPPWLADLSEEAAEARADGASRANVARFVFVGVLLIFVAVLVLSDIACRNRIRRDIEEAGIPEQAKEMSW